MAVVHVHTDIRQLVRDYSDRDRPQSLALGLVPRRASERRSTVERSRRWSFA